MSDPRQRPSGFAQFAAEMKRRHVVRFTLGYAAVAFVLLQLAEIVFPAFGVGETGLRILVVAVALLFPPAAVLAWIYDVTAEGIKRTEALEGAEARRAGRRIPQIVLLGITTVTLVGVGVWMAEVGLIGELVSTEPEASDSDSPVELAAYDPEAPIRSLAVLPLDDFSATGEQDYFTSGMLEELIAQLSQIAGLRVVSRTSVMRYAGSNTPIPQVGRELRVDGVIEGSIRREGDRVRITVQLIHAASDTHVWTHQYDRSVSDLLALQSEVALDIAEQLRAELSPEESSLLTRTATREISPEAQDAYLRGRFELDRGTSEGYHAAMDLFEEALTADEDFAPALAGLASARFVLGMSAPEPSGEEIRLAEREALQALEMDSLSMEAREVLTLIRFAAPEADGSESESAGGTWSEGASVVALPQMVTLSDSSWATAMTQFGRHIEEQVRIKAFHATEAGRAGRLFAARRLLAGGRFDEAAVLATELVREDPSVRAGWEMLARARLAVGDPGGAVDAMGEWSASGEEGAPSAESVAALRRQVREDGATGFWRWTASRNEAALAQGAQVALVDYAAALVGSGAHDQALSVLERAVEDRDPGLLSLRDDPVWDPIRADPRFVELARRTRVFRGAPPVPPSPR